MSWLGLGFRVRVMSWLGLRFRVRVMSCLGLGFRVRLVSRSDSMTAWQAAGRGVIGVCVWGGGPSRGWA